MVAMLLQLCFGSFAIGAMLKQLCIIVIDAILCCAVAALLLQLCNGGSAMEAVLCWLCYELCIGSIIVIAATLGYYALAALPWQLCNGSYAMAGMLWQ